MNKRTPIRLEGKDDIKIRRVTEVGDAVTVEYDGIAGPDAITLPASMSDRAKRLSIRHREWMKKYPPEEA